VTSEEAWNAGLKLAVDKYGKLDIVVNNAGTTYRKKPSIEVTEAEFDKIIAVNVKSLFWSAKIIMPYFVKQGGGIFLSTSSVAGTRVRPGQVFYGGKNSFSTDIVWRLIQRTGTKGFVNTVGRGCVPVAWAGCGRLTCH
jgi:3-oxoacyl-[acyl-carrier protein] reductase